MKRYLLAAVAAAAIATPAQARDGQGYFGIEGGVMFPGDQDVDALFDFVTVQAPATPLAPAGPLDVEVDEAFSANWKTGWDVDAIAGYDFGMFRLEVELGYKKAKRDGFEVDDDALAALNLALNRPSAAPDPGAPGQPALTEDDFEDAGGKIGIFSAMLNGLVDFGDEDGLSFYAGAGIGWARAAALDDNDSAWAGQLIAGVRYAISSNIDLGLKYRYFRTGKLHLEGGALLQGGNPNRLTVGVTAPVLVDQRTDVAIFPEIN